MEISPELLALLSMIVGGVELRVAVQSLKRDNVELKNRIHLVELGKVDKSPAPAPSPYGAIIPVLLWLGIIGVSLGSLAAGEPSVLEAAGSGAAAGSAFGPVGAAVGAGVAVVGLLVWRRTRRKKKRP